MDAEEIQFTSFDEHDIADWQEVERGEILALPELTATPGLARVELARYDEEQQKWCRYGYTNVTADSVESASNAWEAAQDIANIVNERKRPLGESVIEQMPSYPQKKWAQSLCLENDTAPEQEEKVLRTGGPKRGEQPYEAIRVSPSVRIQFDREENVLRIGGDGICELGHVSCPVTVRGNVYADIETVEGYVWCEDNAAATIGTTEGNVRVFDSAKLTVQGEVKGNARSCGYGEFVGNVVQGDTFAEENSELIVESVGGAKTASDDAFLIVGGERIKPEAEDEGIKI
jgi:hypothetical protein